MDDLNVDEFDIDNNTQQQKRSNSESITNTPKKRQRGEVSDSFSLVTQYVNNPTESDSNRSVLALSDFETRWDYVLALLRKQNDILDVHHNITTISDVRSNYFTRADRMLVQIESIRKTETGYLCEFSDKTDKIFGTLNNHVVRDHQRSLEVSTVLWLRNVPVLYVHQSGNCYLVVNTDNLIKVYSKVDE